MAKDLTILVLEDDLLLREVLTRSLARYGKVFAASTAPAALEIINSYRPDIGFIDLYLNKEPRGLEIVRQLHERKTYNVVLSGKEDEETITLAYQNGCNDYYVKGNEKNSIESVMEKFLLTRKHDALDVFMKEEFITGDAETIDQLKQLKEVRHNQDPVLILGPTGVGKTIIARKIHSLAGLEGEFVELNCSAIPENLVESELFGHVKGAFTGAVQDKEGLLLRAHKGIIFLDEVGSLPLNIQAKLLKALEEKCFLPVGGTKTVASDFRIVSATCEDLDDYRKTGQFRNDLYFRLAGINIKLKGLKERKDDINHLITHFLKNSNRKIILNPEVRQLLHSYAWPGNVRELKKVINMLLTREKGLIGTEDLPVFIKERSTEKNSEGMLMTPEIKAMACEIGLYETIELLKTEIMKSVSEDNQGKVNKTIQDLKISTNTYYKLIRNETTPQIHH